MKTKTAISALVLPLLFFAGCGGSGGPDVASVTGIVTLDGKPLENATVMFQPESGRPSFGRTDKEGKFQMEYTLEKSGVMLGTNKVFIRTRMEDDNGRVVQPEILPPKYHDRTELSVNVEDKANEFTFDLASK